MTRTTLLVAIALATTPSVLTAQGFNSARPNASNQRPAFAGQTRAAIIDQDVELQEQIVAEGLSHPWGLDQLPDGSWLVTERTGALRRVLADGTVSAPIDGLPEVDARRQGGLLDVLVRDDFEQSRRVWWSYAEPRGRGRNATAVATGVLSADSGEIHEARVIFQQQPAWKSTLHFGSRLVFDREGALFVTTGERSKRKPQQLAQDVSTHLGKVLRIDPMGGAAVGNPPIENALPEIWSFGHRNIQSAALGPDGAIWTVEHGPRGGDELNRPEAGLNYGWPVVTYGENYSGTKVGKGITAAEGIEQPLYYWDPVIAPSGMAFYEHELFPDWQGSILIGGLAGQALVRLQLDGTTVTGEARYRQGQGRVRDVDVAQDGSVMILTDSGNGELIRLKPGN